MKRRDHLTKLELISLTRTERLPAEQIEHLQQCQECESLLALFRLMPDRSPLPLPNAPTGWIEKAVSIGAKSTGRTVLQRIIGVIVFDSWSAPAPAGVRGHDPDKRKLTLQLAGQTFDLLASHDQSGWLFSGRVEGEGHAALELIAGKTIVAPDANGFYTWESSLPPKKLVVRTGQTETVFTGLSWRSPAV